jgi:ADP-dependent NAD(P)H-hydrate dehydratase / NAD(P)H-hydrate epimerase
VKVVTVEQMRDIEHRADVEHGLPSSALMEHAGLSVAEILRDELGGEVTGLSVLVLVGPGNNGGDGRVAARFLAEWGATLTYYVWKGHHLEEGPEVVPVGNDFGALRAAAERADVVLDALLGTGNARPLDPNMRRALAVVAEERQRRGRPVILAVDLPTGLNADTGAVDEGTIAADITVTLAFPKLGLLLFPGAEFVGELRVGGIGLPAGMAGDVTTDLVDESLARSLLPSRPLESNKGTFGKVMLLAGSLPYPGSGYLASTAAGRVGAGLVTLATTPDLAPIYAAKLSEATFHLLPPTSVPPADRARDLVGGLGGYRALLVGPGLGQAPETRDFLREVFAGLRRMSDADRPSLVVDADGLNFLAREPEWWTLLPPETVLTPHPGEIGRLLGGTRVSGGGPDRLQAASWAIQWQHVVVLKGACTLIAAPDGRTRVYWPPNPALATAGTGDVLAGTISGLLAQGLEPFNAASLGVYVHGRAGLAVATWTGEAGLLASDLLTELPVALRETRRI